MDLKGDIIQESDGNECKEIHFPNIAFVLKFFEWLIHRHVKVDTALYRLFQFEYGESMNSDQV